MNERLAASALVRSDDFELRFGGVARLFGRAGLERLRAAHVCVVGVGGVGSWTVEALARSGVGAVTMIDLDDVCVTNVNRQLHALDGQMGRTKIDVLAERVAAIQPACRVTCLPDFFTAATADRLLATRYDFVVDAIDSLTQKCLLLAGCRDRAMPAITIGSAGGRCDGTAVQVADLGAAEQDEMLRQLRRKLRRDYGFTRKRVLGVTCVFSPERPVFPWADGTARAVREPDSEVSLDCSTGFGTACFVTGAFGFAAAGEVVRRIASADL